MRSEKNFFADTSFLIDLLRAREEAVELIESDADVVMSSISIFELGRKVDFDLSQVREKAIVDLRPEDAEKAFEIYRNMKDKGEKVNNIDYLLAAQSINLEKPIVTTDEDFRKIEDLDVLYYRD